jgi:hypothetical protein
VFPVRYKLNFVHINQLKYALEMGTELQEGTVPFKNPHFITAVTTGVTASLLVFKLQKQ